MTDIAWTLSVTPEWQGCQWSLNGESYEGLVWDASNPVPKPALQEIEAAYEREKDNPAHRPRNLAAELDALKAKLFEKNVITEQEIKQHGLG